MQQPIPQKNPKLFTPEDVQPFAAYCWAHGARLVSYTEWLTGGYTFDIMGADDPVKLLEGYMNEH